MNCTLPAPVMRLESEGQEAEFIAWRVIQRRRGVRRRAEGDPKLPE